MPISQVGFSRSTDGGKTWSKIVRLVGNVTNLRGIAQGGVDYTNNAAVLIKLPSGRERILWQYGSQNNPSIAKHGKIYQRHSDDDGETWSWPPRDISATGVAVGLPGAVPGPGQGVQLRNGKVAQPRP